MEKETPVIVLGSSLTGVGVCRALGRSGIPAFSVCPAGELLRSSRWYRRLPGLPEPVPGAGELESILDRCGLESAVLMPCADDWARAVTALPERLQSRFPAVLTRREIVDVLVDKWSFACELRRLGIPHPVTRVVSSRDALRALPDDAFEGTFLKPCHSLEFARRHGVKAFLARDKQEARRLLDRMVEEDFPILLQEYIPGPATHHFFVDGYVDRTGRTRALFARQRLRMYPPLFGNSTLMESVGLEAVQGAVESITRLIQGLGFTGIFSAEFKRDERDGLFKILEVNARPWWYVEFAARSGVDVCRLAYQEALGHAVETIEEYPLGRRCVYLSQDYKVFRADPQAAGGLWGWLRSWRGASETIFCWDDPGPGLAYARSLFRQGRGTAGNVAAPRASGRVAPGPEPQTASGVEAPDVDCAAVTSRR